MNERSTRIIGAYAVVAAIIATIVAPLLALSYFAIPDGIGSLDQGSVAAWAEPARSHLAGLVTWSSPDRVYATYVQVLGLCFPGLYLCARVVRSRRPAALGGVERWGWRLALAGYAIAGACLLVVSAMLVVADPNGDAVNTVFLAGMLPGMLLAVVGSSVLGIGLIRSGAVARVTGWLLALAIPLMVVGSGVLGHNSLGMAPLLIAWAVPGWHLARNEPIVGASSRRPTGNLATSDNSFSGSA
jgi:hypothetical protein